MSQRDSIKERLNTIFQDVFDDDEIEITEETTANDIEEWDSLNHITLMVAIEKEFDVTLKADEIGRLSGVGELIDILYDSAKTKSTPKGSNALDRQ